MSYAHLQITEDLIGYIRSVSPPEPPLLGRLREETAAQPLAVMQITPEQGHLFQFFVRLLGVRRAIEIGVFTGYSSLSVALALPADGKLIACDVSEEWTSIAKRYWAEAGVQSKIELHLRPATATLDELIASGVSGSFDFAFIDADKTGYAAYYERCLKLIRPGGLIAIDNVLWHGRVLDPASAEEDTVALRKLNAMIATDPRVDMVLLPIGDGLTLVRPK